MALSAEQLAIVSAVQACYDRTAEEIAEQLRSRAVIDQTDEVARRLEPGSEEFKCVIAQNVIRTALEATLERMLPYAPGTVVELGLRLASYCVSAIPIEQQEGAMPEFLRVFPDLHRGRMAAGIHLQTGWVIEGEDGERSNVPRLS